MISLIVAMTENGVIGRDGAMPWRASADLRRFRRLTMGHHLVMGRKTYESIGRPLPGRVSIVLSRSACYSEADVRVARSLEEALQVAAHDKEIFITGGDSNLGSNIVHRKRAAPAGVSWTATRIDEASEFVASTDIWFRPVQSANAPDGCLYILDMYREVIEQFLREGKALHCYCSREELDQMRELLTWAMNDRIISSG